MAKKTKYVYGEQFISYFKAVPDHIKKISEKYFIITFNGKRMFTV